MVTYEIILKMEVSLKVDCLPNAVGNSHPARARMHWYLTSFNCVWGQDLRRWQVTVMLIPLKDLFMSGGEVKWVSIHQAISFKSLTS